MRQAGLYGIEQALQRLQVRSPYVVFGHTHRAGPLAGDDRGEWRTAAGTELVNSGCWVSEPSFLGPDPGRSPYRVGFAVVLEDAGPPVLVNLLDPVTRWQP